MPVIELINLSKKFKGKKGSTVEAVKDLSLSVDQGEIFGFLGPNGAGKSTTIKIMTGLISPSEGNVRIMGVDSGSHLSRKHIGYLPENPAFYDYVTSEEYLAFVGRIFGMNRVQLAERVEHYLKLLDLWDARRRPIRTYSKGMVQRVGLAQCLIHDPDVYILDEPMSGLDPVGRVLVKDIIIDLKKNGKTVFFSTHITSDVESVCDRVGVIFHGELRRVEKVESILTQGVIGYQIRIRAEGGRTKEIFIEKDQLTSFMNEIRSSGQEIAMIEPKRKNLEAFFMDIVQGRSS